MTFKDFVCSHPDCDDPRGDFIADVRTDDTFPTHLTTWGDVELYLRSQGACFEAYEPARYLWHEFVEAGGVA